MVDFVLGRLKFTYQGNWAVSTAYIKDDIVTYGGQSYVCLYNHTSSSNASGGFYSDSANWNLISAGMQYKGSWTVNTYYKLNDVVKQGADIWICTAGHTSGSTFQATESNFALLVGGLEFANTWANNVQYVVGDIVGYGGYTYVALQDALNNTPSTNTQYWSVLTPGFKPQGVWNASTKYKTGDFVTYGAYSYVAQLDTMAQAPSLASIYWKLVASGSEYIGFYSNSTNYKLGDIVSYGGYNYISNIDTVGVNPSNTTNWTTINTGFRYNGAWSSSALYQVGDVVSFTGTTYVSTTYDNLANTPGVANSWSIVAQGSANTILSTTGDLLYQSNTGSLARLPIGANNQVLIVNAYGLPSWSNSNFANSVYYVAVNGSDNNSGTSLQAPFATIQKAAQTAPNNSTIYVKSGVYSEILPITVGPGVSVIGDSQRNTIVQPANSTYYTSNMWQVSDASLIKAMLFRGLTGFTANSSYPSDITKATLGGVFVAFNPASPVLTKSPYIIECSAISTGGTGAYIDGSVHASGNKSMLFQEFTQINNDGVGFYVTNGGRSEIVSCFTYYCWFGMASSGGGSIRGLNNNNSYGRYGSSAYGFDSTEVTANAALTGNMMTIQPTTGTITNYQTGEYIRGGTSGANAYVLNYQTSANNIYYSLVAGSNTFSNGELVIGSTSGSNATVANTGNGQAGFVLVVNGLESLPNTGGSIVFNSGDSTNSYIIQSLSGTYVNSQSNIVFVLANQKPIASPSGNTFVIRYLYSQVRLTGHDFLNIGTGNTTTTNYPGTPINAPVQSQQVNEYYPGRVFYVATDQSGNFFVGKYFNVQQATGVATLNSSAFNLSGLSQLRLGSIGAQLGESINEFSSDVLMSANSINKVPTQSAVRTYVAASSNSDLNYGRMYAYFIR